MGKPGVGVCQGHLRSAHSGQRTLFIPRHCSAPWVNPKWVQQKVWLCRHTFGVRVWCSFCWRCRNIPVWCSWVCNEESCKSGVSGLQSAKRTSRLRRLHKLAWKTADAWTRSCKEWTLATSRLKSEFTTVRCKLWDICWENERNEWLAASVQG